MPFLRLFCVRLILSTCLFFVCWCVGLTAAQAEIPLTPGFQTLGIWEPARRLRLDVALWYPARRVAAEVKYNDWTFMVARGAAPVAGLHPLVLLSHDASGSRFTLHFLAEALARSGFVVAAPTHVGDNMDDMARMFSVDQPRGRALELKALLDVLLETERVAAMVDPQRVAVVGVGPGASAALLLAGARMDSSGWAGFCRRAGVTDPYCSPWVSQRMNVMAEALVKMPVEEAALSRDQRVRAAVLAAPAYGMFFSKKSMADVRIPLLLMRADLDGVNRAPHHAEIIRDALPVPPVYDVLENTDKPSLMAPCSPALTEMLPDLCTPSPEANSARSRRQLVDKTVRFLIKQLGDATSP